MTDRTLLGPWIRRFLLEHIVGERNLARNTQASYRDTLTLLLPFLRATSQTPVDRLAIEDLSPSMLRRFLEHLEHDRGCKGARAISASAPFTRSRSLSACTAPNTSPGVPTSARFPSRKRPSPPWPISTNLRWMPS